MKNFIKEQFGFWILAVVGFFLGFFIFVLLAGNLRQKNSVQQYEIYEEYEFYAIDGDTLFLKDDIKIIEIEIDYNSKLYSEYVSSPVIYRKKHYNPWPMKTSFYYEYRVVLPISYIG